MTDRDRLIALLTEWGVGFNGENAQLADAAQAPSDVVLYQGDAKIEGYGGFMAVFQFDDAGAFKQVSIWE